MIAFYFKFVSNARPDQQKPRLRLCFECTFGWRSRKIVYDPRSGFAPAFISHTPGTQTFWPRVVIYYSGVYPLLPEV